MKVWRRIGLAVIILIMVICTGNYLNSVRRTGVTARRKGYRQDSDSTTMEFENEQGDIIYSIDDYICPLGTEAVIYYDKDIGELLKIRTRTIL